MGKNELKCREKTQLEELNRVKKWKLVVGDINKLKQYLTVYSSSRIVLVLTVTRTEEVFRILLILKQNILCQVLPLVQSSFCTN